MNWFQFLKDNVSCSIQRISCKETSVGIEIPELVQFKDDLHLDYHNDSGDGEKWANLRYFRDRTIMIYWKIKYGQAAKRNKGKSRVLTWVVSPRLWYIAI